MNPFLENGTPLDQQVKNWDKLNVHPFDKNEVHPYTRARTILMDSIETEGAAFSQRMSQLSDNIELKRQLAHIRRIEQQQQKMINWLMPSEESTLEATLAHEQMEVDLTAVFAASETEKDIKAALDYCLAEDFDHLYRFANLYEMLENKPANKILGDLTEVFPGRPTITSHVHPSDTIKKSYSADTDSNASKLHVLTSFAVHQQTMNYYQNAGNRMHDYTGRGLYQEIGMAEEEHSTIFGSLLDNSMTLFELLVLHEYNECYMYHSCMVSEVDDRIKGIWRDLLAEELEHLRIAADLMRQFDRKDPCELYGEFPAPVIFTPNKEYIRNIIALQIDLTHSGEEYMPVNRLPGESMFFSWRRSVNNGGLVPSEEIIRENIEARGRDFRIETEGPHPVERLRSIEEPVR